MKKGFIVWMLFLCMVFTSCGLENATNHPGNSQKPGESQNVDNSQKPDDLQKPDDSQQSDDSQQPDDSQETDNEKDSVKKYTYTEFKKTMWSTSSLNVRTKPDKSGDVMGYLQKDDEVQVTAQCNETSWYRIQFKGSIGYVSNKYLTDESPIKEPSTSKPQPNEPNEPNEPEVSETTMYATANVNVRSKPNTTGTVLGVLKTNESVIALGEAVDGWQKVIYNEKEGYVSSKYLTTEYFEMHPEITAEDIVIPELNDDSPVIVIDAGHQEFTNSDPEPIGPGATKTKKKVSRGTHGCVSDWWEYELNLVVAMKLKEELLSRGYQVVMIRETHEINISNSERAKVANNINADAFIRIHANGSNNPEEKGAFTICQTPENIYNGDRYESFRKLADCILDGFAASTGCVKMDVWETDTMSGINWAQVPTTILEMGYMTNPEEDALMASQEYQDKMVDGIADGLDKFFE